MSPSLDDSTVDYYEGWGESPLSLELLELIDRLRSYQASASSNGESGLSRISVVDPVYLASK
jgi:hypothetical protein